MIKQNFWKNKKILITGHNGFKGSWMTMILYLLEAKVYGYSLNNRANRKNEKIFKLKNQLTGYTYGDIRNEKKLHAYLKKISPDVVIHMAAQPLVIDSYKDTKFNYETNVNGLINLLLMFNRFYSFFNDYMIYDLDVEAEFKTEDPDILSEIYKSIGIKRQ